MYWPRLSTEQVKSAIFSALAKNRNYRSEKVLGIPATFLDSRVFYEDAPFLKDAPFLSMLIANPNHIGCHTLEGAKEPMFSGTQEIEREVIRLCAEEIFAAKPGGYDGYVASGGTEANIEAAWIYRNYFRDEKNAANDSIRLVYSKDTHYSFAKAADLLGIRSIVAEVNEHSRAIDMNHLRAMVQRSVSEGAKHFIVIVNVGTTMFGSVDDIDTLTELFLGSGLDFRLHLDAAFGGFMYPFVSGDKRYSFANPHVSSVTVDGHKLLQAPYGTGVFLVRKNLIRYVCTKEASYVAGKDYTLCGSRSGTNAASMWMIMHHHGSEGWKLKMEQLLDKTNSLCAALDDLNIRYYRNPAFNIVTIRAGHITPALAETFCLVPDNHEQPRWYKIVVMDHVRQGVLDSFVSALAVTNPSKTAA